MYALLQAASRAVKRRFAGSMKTFWTYLAVAAAAQATIVMGVNRLKELAPAQHPPLDLRVRYAPAEAAAVLEAYGSEGRQVYGEMLVVWGVRGESGRGENGRRAAAAAATANTRTKQQHPTTTKKKTKSWSSSSTLCTWPATAACSPRC